VQAQLCTKKLSEPAEGWRTILPLRFKLHDMLQMRYELSQAATRARIRWRNAKQCRLSALDERWVSEIPAIQVQAIERVDDSSCPGC
jgi:hypothetical protein